MGFSITYFRLFDVALRLHYHLDRGTTEFDALTDEEREEVLADYRRAGYVSEELSIAPTPETRRTLRRMGWLWRRVPDGFFVAAHTREAADGSRVLERMPGGSIRLRFALTLRDPSFVNRSNGPFGTDGRLLYHFANRDEHAGTARRYPHLTLEPPSYRYQTFYRAGDLVRRTLHGRNVYLALRDGTHSRPPQSGPGTSNWLRLAGDQYANEADRVVLRRALQEVALPDEDPVQEARFHLVRADGSREEVGGVSAADLADSHSYRLDLSAFSSGRYDLEIEGTYGSGESFSRSEAIYLDDSLPPGGVFGLVEIVHPAGAPGSTYRLWEPDGRLRQPSFRLAFLNRYTYWRYHFAEVPDPVPDPADFEQVDDRAYVIREAKPLTRSLVPIPYDGDRLLPNPTGTRVRPEEDRVYSDVFIHR